jgi:hypothetical protein
MGQEFIQKELWIEGLISDNSESKIENVLSSMVGIQNIKASYMDSKIWLSYYPDTINLKLIIKRMNRPCASCSPRHIKGCSDKR